MSDNPMRVKDHGFTGDAYTVLLLQAMEFAANEWERTFIGDQITKVGQYKENAFLSPKQLAVVKKIMARKPASGSPAPQVQAEATTQVPEVTHGRTDNSDVSGGGDTADPSSSSDIPF